MNDRRFLPGELLWVKFGIGEDGGVYSPTSQHDDYVQVFILPPFLVIANRVFDDAKRNLRTKQSLVLGSNSAFDWCNDDWFERIER